MTDIDVSKIRPGDTVRVRYIDRIMVERAVPPIEFKGIAHRPGAHNRHGSPLWVGPLVLSDKDDYLTVLEHIPAHPDWADALVVRDKDGDLWMKGGHRRPGEQLWTRQNDHNTILATADLNDWEPITVVIDADGNPPEPEPEWLDADALDKLPVDSVTLGRFDGSWPRWKGHDGRWRHTGASASSARGCTSRTIAPARVLWAPGGDR